MTQEQLQSFYTTRKSTFSESLSSIRKKINLVSNIRLATAIAFLIVIYFGFTQHNLLYFAALLLVLFVILVRRHSILFDEKTHLENLVTLNDAESKAAIGDYASLPTGVEYIDPHHPYSHDLDIFGEGSLFQYINRCNTLGGKRKFADRLLSPLPSDESIYEQQEAIRELSSLTDFRQHFQAAGKEMDEQRDDRAQLQAWLAQPAFLYGKPVYKYLLAIFPVITIALIVLAFFFPALKGYAILSALAQWAILGFHIKKVNAFHDYISRKKNILQKFARLLHYLQHNTFKAPLLKRLSEHGHEADVKVKSLASLVSSLDARLNAMTTLVVNSLLLYDLQCVYRLEKWKADHAEKLIAWLNTVDEMEVLGSLGTFAFNHPNFQYAAIHKKLSIEIEELSHPLIRENERVANDLVLGNNQSVLIVTGANMAGKSTFLRTIGVNLILALSGAPVCAQSFRCPVINLRTGMRTADSLKDHQSYFYAELNRLKTIMDELRNDKPLLILLDEILKGTNSTDKQAGSIALVKQLLPHPCLAMVATHDLALGELQTEYPDRVKNYCFEATIENDQLSFDYKLKPGLAQKMNATFLMKKMGIIPA
jgi:ABC-type multidrug transport system fused ATPase/permease subunit